MTIRVYHGDPTLQALQAGFGAYAQAAYEREMRKRAERTANRQRYQSQILEGVIQGGTAAVGGAIGGFAGAQPGVQSAAPGSGFAAGTSLTSAGTPATGFSWSGAFTGASIGAGFGQAFTGGGAGGLISATTAAATGLRREREFASEQGFRAAEGRARATEATQRLLDTWSIENYGVPYAQGTEIQRGQAEFNVQRGLEAQRTGGMTFGPTAGGMPSVGPAIRPEDELVGPRPAPGPIERARANAPPGMEPDWGPTHRVLGRMASQADSTFRDPNWRQSMGEDVASAAEAAYNVKVDEVVSRPGYRPSTPRLQIPKIGGGFTDARPGWNELSNGGAIITNVKGDFEQFVAATKAGEAPQWVDVGMLDGTSVRMGVPSSKVIQVNGDKVGVSVDSQGNSKFTKLSAPGAGKAFNAQAFIQERMKQTDEEGNPIYAERAVQEALYIRRKLAKVDKQEQIDEADTLDKFASILYPGDLMAVRKTLPLAGPLTQQDRDNAARLGSQVVSVLRKHRSGEIILDPDVLRAVESEGALLRELLRPERLPLGGP